jgi:RNA polymerase sigma-70 factor (ECF subfamily)
MNDAERAALEDEVRALCEKGEVDAAATQTLRGYGGEIFGFLVAVHRDEASASDAFSAFAEGVWRGLPGFAWACTLRTWAYAIARNASRMQRRDAARRDWHGNRAGESALEDVAQAVRTATLGFLKTEKRSRLEALRDALSAEDRALLILRVDRGLAWNDLARVLAENEEPLADADVPREAARLRKRFQLIKDDLRERARREGLCE